MTIEKEWISNWLWGLIIAVGIVVFVFLIKIIWESLK